MTIFLSPFENVTLVKWSLGDELAPSGPYWNNRPTYFIYYSHGLSDGPFKFWVEMKVIFFIILY